MSKDFAKLRIHLLFLIWWWQQLLYYPCLCRYNKHHMWFVMLVEYAYVDRDYFTGFPKWSKHSVITPLIYFCARNNEWGNCSWCSSGWGTEEGGFVWVTANSLVFMGAKGLHLPFSPPPCESLSNPVAASRLQAFKEKQLIILIICQGH